MSRDVNNGIAHLAGFLNSATMRTVPDDYLFQKTGGVDLTVGDLRAVLIAMTEAYEILHEEVRAARSAGLTYDRNGEAIEYCDGGPAERWVESMHPPVGLLPLPVPK
jgi:hypothetical protein